MENKNNYPIQIRLFDKIRDILPPSTLLANDIAELLEISTDSAYRRMRGETPLSIDETALLCKHFNVALDMFASETHNVTFNYNNMSSLEGFRTYMNDILFDLQQLAKIDNSELFYAAVDMPIVHNFKYPYLGSFIMFFWIKAILNDPNFENQKFSIDIVPDDIKEVGLKIYNTYCEINSTEIWNLATVDCTMSQIEFFWDSGLFANKTDAIMVCQQYDEQIRTIEMQAERSSKALNTDIVKENNFMLYISDIEIGNNSILTRKGNNFTTYLSFHTFNKLVTMNPAFCKTTEVWINNMIRKATLISGVGEKQRYKFFKAIYDKIEKLRLKIEAEN